MNRALPIGLVLLAATQTTWTQQPRTHDLALTPEHVHWGYYDSRVPPVLRIASGDRVRVETMVAGGLQRLRLAGASESEIPESLKAVELACHRAGPGRTSHDRADLRGGRRARRRAGSPDSRDRLPPSVRRCCVQSRRRRHPGRLSLRAFPAAAMAARRRPRRVQARDLADASRPSSARLGSRPHPSSEEFRAARPDGTAAIWTTRISSRDRRCICRCTCQAPCCRSATATACRATAK